MALPPGPARTTAVQLWRWLWRPLPFLEECRARYGETFLLRIATMPPLVITSNPEHAREVFAANGDDMHAGEVAVALKPFLGARSVIMLDGPEHMRMRKLVLPPFHGERMQAYGRDMIEITHDAVDAWPVGERFAVHRPMQRVTMEVILRTVFGLDEQGARARLGAMLEDLLETATWPPLLIPAVQRDLGPWSPWGRYQRKAARANDVLLGEIRRRREVGTAGRVDILSMLLDVRDEQGNGLGEEDLRDQLVTLLVAGHETTATSLAWAFHWILGDARVRGRLGAELREATRDGAITPERIAKMEYLDAVIRETMRLRPVIPLVGRVLQRPMRVAGYDLPAGVAVAPSVYLTHRNPAVFENPTAFEPERFLRKKYAPSEWFPFGGGIRRCIGMAFALYELKMVLATVLSRADLRAAEGKAVVPVRRAITLSPSGGMPVVLASRWPRPAPRAEVSPVA
jgi:cytochrome P450